jgi:hypothetical protein
MSTPALELKGELQSLPDDDELGSYIVDGLLNTTGSSCIWRGHHCDTGEAVAMKPTPAPLSPICATKLRSSEASATPAL